MKSILVYGTLRAKSKRNPNFGRWGKQVWRKDLTLKGYVLHDLRYYPALCAGEGSVRAELHEVSNQTHVRLRNMELSAGYQEIILPIDGIDAALYVMTPEQLTHHPRIESGDWAQIS